MSVPLPASFAHHVIDADGVRVNTYVSGDGPPVLLLHGYPQTHLVWHRVAPVLAREHTVVLTDLRGYGDSDKPPSAPDHAPYSKRAMAHDQLLVMRSLGFGRFAVAGHDRGARVGHRLALDEPGAVTRLAVLDIVPTRHAFRHADAAFALGYYHWFFLAAGDGVPERMIGADPGHWVHSHMKVRHGRDAFDPAALDEYVRCFSDPVAVHASCEDYRAAASIDLRHDDADADAGRRVTCPVLALWGERGFVGRTYDVLDVWRRYADDVRGRAVPSGHYVPEEAPEATAELLGAFLSESPPGNAPGSPPGGPATTAR